MVGKKSGMPKYVDVYNKLLKNIIDGTYPEGSKLPTENELSEQLNVSRMTLRQSLLLLKEDGFIETRQGSGNYVKSEKNIKESHIIDSKSISISNIIDREIKSIEYELEILPSTEYIKKIFKVNKSVYIEVHGVFYDNDNKAVACSLNMILTDIIEKYNIDLNCIDEVKEFLEIVADKNEFKRELEFKIVPNSQLAKRHNVKSEYSMYMLVVENIKDKENNIMLHNKYYVPAEIVNIVIN